MTYQQISRMYGVPVEIIRDSVRQIREKPHGRLSRRDQERLLELIEQRYCIDEENFHETPFDFK